MNCAICGEEIFILNEEKKINVEKIAVKFSDEYICYPCDEIKMTFSESKHVEQTKTIKKNIDFKPQQFFNCFKCKTEYTGSSCHKCNTPNILFQRKSKKKKKKK